MSHDHTHAGHDHHQVIPLTGVNRAFIIGITLNFLFVIAEAITGLAVNSLSLLSDAGHNLADVASLGLSLLAFRLLKVKPSKQFTYGYRKTSILVALLNAVLLLVSVGAIGYEAVGRFFHPAPLPGKMIALIAGAGILINSITALLFFRNKEKDINIKGAYLHLMLDALVSAAIVAGGVLMYFTHWYWLDPVLGILIAIVILWSTWKLLKESLRLSLDGVPADIDLEAVKAAAVAIAGIKEIHHVHVWALSSTENAMTGHIVVGNDMTQAAVKVLKDDLRHRLQHLNIRHVTLETEFSDEVCVLKDC